MADIRVRISGRTYFEVDNTLAAILVDALPGQVEYVKRVPATPPPTTWRYYVEKLQYRYVIRRSKGAQYETLTADDAASAKRVWPDIPPAVLAEYEAISPRLRLGLE